MICWNLSHKVIYCIKDEIFMYPIILFSYSETIGQTVWIASSLYMFLGELSKYLNMLFRTSWNLTRYLIWSAAAPVPRANLWAMQWVTKEFQQSIAEVIADELVGQVKGSGVFSVMLDESTDVSVHQNCVVYVRYLASIGGKVQPVTQFLGIRQDCWNSFVLVWWVYDVWLSTWRSCSCIAPYNVKKK
jgi:hypothetical protein